MITIRLISIGLMMTTFDAWSAQLQRTPRALPPTPTNPAIQATQPSQSILVMKEATEFMINEFKDACGSYISTLQSIYPAPQKPSGYGTRDPYYTPQDKSALVGQLNKLIDDKSNEATRLLKELDTKETSQGPLSIKDIMSTYIKISGTLNEGRKNCSFSLTQMEKQDLKTQTLKQCSSTPQNQTTQPKKSRFNILPKALQKSAP